MKQRSKAYLKSANLKDKNKEYDIDTAIGLLKKICYANFDATVELHINLNLDSKKSDQQVRTSVLLPHGTGKEKKILVFARGDSAKEAQTAGADIVGDEKTIKKIEEGFLDFDIVVAHPAVMKDLTRIAKILGPKGLMPNPKAGTVTEKLAATIKEIKKGKSYLKTTEKEPIIHTPIGKTSFPPEKLKENLEAVISSIKSAKPSKVKEPFIKSVYIAPAIGPSIKVKMKETETK